MEWNQVESGGGCEREEEEVCVFDQYKCDLVSKTEPTYTEASVVGKTQLVSIFGHRNWAKLEVWFLSGLILLRDALQRCRGGAKDEI